MTILPRGPEGRLDRRMTAEPTMASQCPTEKGKPHDCWGWMQCRRVQRSWPTCPSTRKASGRHDRRTQRKNQESHLVYLRQCKHPRWRNAGLTAGVPSPLSEFRRQGRLDRRSVVALLYLPLSAAAQFQTDLTAAQFQAGLTAAQFQADEDL